MTQDNFLPRRDFLRGMAVGGAALAVPGLLGACTGGLGGGSNGGGGGGGSTLKIAYITPQSGPLAGFHAADDYLLNLVRESWSGGISAGDQTYQIEIIQKDSQSDANRAADVAREAILDDAVDLIITTTTPGTTNPVSDQAEANGVPCINSVCPWESWFFGRGGTEDTGFEYTFLFFTGVSGEVEAVPPVWASMTDTNQTIAALWPNNSDGDAFRTGFTPAIQEIGATLIDAGPYAEPAQDYTTQIAQFRGADAQIFTGVPAPPDFATFWRQAAQNGYRPRYAYVHKAILFPAGVESLGDQGENLMTSAWWTPDVPYSSSLEGGPSARELAEGYQGESGNQWLQPMAFNYATFEVAAAALAAANDPKDKAAVADAIRNLSVDTIVGPVDFTNGPAPNVAFNPVYASQWQRGEGDYPYELKIVDNTLAPDVEVTGEILPLPGT
jgi:branched-chain amino acid transport system substrate-binding protein